MTIYLPKKCSEYRCHYPMQYKNQPAYIAFDPENRTLCASYNGEIGNAVPADVYNGRAFRFTFPSMARLRDVRAVMQKIAPLCEQYCESYEAVWNGSNWIGRGNDKLLEHIGYVVTSSLED